MRVSFKLLHKHYNSIQFKKIDDILFELNCLSSEKHAPIKQAHSLASPPSKYIHTVKNQKKINWNDKYHKLNEAYLLSVDLSIMHRYNY